jgi:hypothetical protein
MAPETAGSATLCFIRLKIHLDVGDSEAAEAQIQKACSCPDFTPSILEVSLCPELKESDDVGFQPHFD